MLPKRGRPGIPIFMQVERDLTPEDLRLLEIGVDDDGNPLPKKAPPMLQRLKASHHTAARLLAAGLSVKEVATKVGRTPQRIGDMQRTDPAFQDLIAYYESMIEETDLEEIREMQGMFRGIGLDALDEVRERLDDPKRRAEIPMSELRMLATAAADRTDAPVKVAQPVQTTPQKITIRLGPRDIEPKEPNNLKLIDQQGNPVEEKDDV